MEISLNGQDFTNASFTFAYHAEPLVEELAPPDGSVTVRRRGIPGLAHEVTPEEIAVLVAWIDERLRSLGFGV